VTKLGVFCERSGAPDPNDHNGNFLSVSRHCGIAPKFRRAVVLEHLSPCYDLNIHNNSLDNLELSIKERIFFVKDKRGVFTTTPNVSGSHFKLEMSKFTRKIRRLLPHSTPIERHEVPEFYKGAKKEAYAKAAESLLAHGIRKTDSDVKIFIKVEKVNLTIKPKSVPRAIQPRDRRYGVELAKFLKPIEKRIITAIDKTFHTDGSIVVMKGINAAECGRQIKQKWDKFLNPVAVSADAQRLDQHVHEHALHWEHSIYLNCFNNKRNKKELSKLLSWQIETTGRGYCPDGKIKYRKTGMRCSGDINTSLGNILIVCGMVHTFLSTLTYHVEFINNGDDCCFIMERHNQHHFSVEYPKYMLLLGFSFVMEDPVDILERIDFCQTQPVFDGSEYIMVRKISSIAKDCISTVYNNTVKTLHSYYNDVGTAGMSLTGGIPVWQEYYKTLMRGLPAPTVDMTYKREGGLFRWARDMHKSYSPPTPEARHSFYLAFGIDPDHQIALEDIYKESDVGWDSMEPKHAPNFLWQMPLTIRTGEFGEFY